MRSSCIRSRWCNLRCAGLCGPPRLCRDRLLHQAVQGRSLRSHGTVAATAAAETQTLSASSSSAPLPSPSPSPSSPSAAVSSSRNIAVNDGSTLTAPEALRSPAPSSDSTRAVSAGKATPSLPSEAVFRSSLQYCIDHVKQYDPNGHLVTLFAPSSLRSAVFVLRAFDVELSRIRQSSSDSRIAGMKLAWWATTVRSIFASPAAQPPQQPICIMLHYLVHRHQLTQRLLSRMLEARTAQLQHQQPENIAQLDARSEQAFSSLYYLCLQCTDRPHLAADHAASHVGRGAGITALLRSLPYHAAQQQLHIPLTVVQHAGLDPASVFSGADSPALQQAVFELASNAKAHLHHARQLSAELRPDERRLLLDAVVCDRWLDRLEASNFHVLERGLWQTERQGWEPLKLRWQLWRRASKGGL